LLERRIVAHQYGAHRNGVCRDCVSSGPSGRPMASYLDRNAPYATATSLSHGRTLMRLRTGEPHAAAGCRHRYDQAHTIFPLQ
jgi:hypothetical protein